MKKLIVSIFLMTFCVCGFAMDEKMEQVNAIKKSHDYLYGEATMKTIAEAGTLAFELLQVEVERWLSSAAVAPSVVRTSSVVESPSDVGESKSPSYSLHDIADTLVLRRAEMYRVFAFVKKDALLSGKTEQNQPYQKNDSVVRSVTPYKMQRGELMSKQTEKVIRKWMSLDNEAIQRIKKARTFFDLSSILPPLKEQGLITGYGKYATVDHPEDYYLIVYDIAGNIKALLEPGEEKRRNLNTGADDSLDNYRGCGAIWFALR